MTAQRSQEVIVVGAGSAGCALAGRLSADPAWRVVLLEAGPDWGRGAKDAIARPSFLDALSQPGATWSALTARRSTDGSPRPYPRGRGLGGSSSINAMVALRSHPQDHARWVQMGATNWSWEDVSPWFDRTALTTNPAADDELGAVSSALLAAGVGAFRAPLTRDLAGRRVSAADAYLENARDRENLVIRTDALVDRVIVDGGRALGVRLSDGSEILADETVVAAGAIHSPAILLRSGVDRRGIGRNLKDHAAVPFTLRLRAGFERDPRTLAISVVSSLSSGESDGDIQLLAMDHLGPSLPGVGMLMVALMRVESEGFLSLRSMDPHVEPAVEMQMLSSANDLRRLRSGARRARELLGTPDFARIAEVDDVDLSDDGLRAGLGDYVHASGTCRMGAAEDPDAVVDNWGRVIGMQGLRVCDASVMPDLPRANTHLITVVIAERVADQMLNNNSSIG